MRAFPVVLLQHFKDAPVPSKDFVLYFLSLLFIIQKDLLAILLLSWANANLLQLKIWANISLSQLVV